MADHRRHRAPGIGDAIVDIVGDFGHHAVQHWSLSIDAGVVTETANLDAVQAVFPLQPRGGRVPYGARARQAGDQHNIRTFALDQHGDAFTVVEARGTCLGGLGVGALFNRLTLGDSGACP